MVRDLFYSSVFWYLVFPASLVEEIIFLPVYVLGASVNNRLAYTWIYFWIFYSNLLVWFCFLMPVPECLNYYSFVVYFDVSGYACVQFFSMYMCVHIYLCACIHVYMCACFCFHVSVCVCELVSSLYVCMCILVSVSEFMSMTVCVCVCTFL